MQVLEPYLRLSEEIPGWVRGEQAKALALASFALPGVPTIVQIGSFFGAAAILLAGARRAKGSGKVFCVDPFDCSGDEFRSRTTNACWPRPAAARCAIISRRTSGVPISTAGLPCSRDVPKTSREVGANRSTC